MTTNQKLCTKCNAIKELQEFNKDKNKPDGLQAICRECAAEYRINNRESRRLKDKIYRENNKEAVNKSKLATWNKHKKQYTDKKSKDMVKATNKKYRSSAKGKASNLNTRVRRLATLESAGSVTSKEVEKLLKDTTTCSWCNKNLSDTGVVTHIDHHVPLSKGGSNTIDNLRAICSTCNLSKGPKLPEEFAEYLLKDSMS